MDLMQNNKKPSIRLFSLGKKRYGLSHSGIVDPFILMISLDIILTR